MNPDDVILHYRLIRKIGEGGMGVVYQAEDTRLRRMVALKFLSSRAASHPELRARFFREAQAAGALDHPNICTVYDIQESLETIFLVMAYVEGIPLNKLIGGRPVAPAWSVNLALQIAEGLCAAHQKKIVHRDIKPGNVLITRTGVARITDFGLALFTDRSRITAPGAILGTVAYMSPEQAMGREVDRRSDLWSLGIVLYEMLSGEQPFRGPDSPSVLRGIVRQPTPALRTAGAIAPGLARILDRLLAKNPTERFQYADDLCVDLRAVLRELREPRGAPPWMSAEGVGGGPGSGPEDVTATDAGTGPAGFPALKPVSAPPEGDSGEGKEDTAQRWLRALSRKVNRLLSPRKTP
jgi:serine/threonine-protein kinase